MSEHESQYRDAAEYNEASYTPDIAAQIDSPADNLAETLADLNLPRPVIDRIAAWHESQIIVVRESATASSLKSVVAMFLSPGNLALRAWALAYAAGLDAAQGRSMSSLASELHCTRAAISKETNHWSDLLSLPRSRYLKSQEARESYSKVQTEHHWRRPTASS